jgi:hypothetical protein
MAGGCQADEVSHCRAADEANARALRQPQEREQPFAANLLEGACRRRCNLQYRILVPGSGEHIGCQGGGQRPADDKAEKRPPALATVAGGNLIQLPGTSAGSLAHLAAEVQELQALNRLWVGATLRLSNPAM